VVRGQPLLGVVLTGDCATHRRDWRCAPPPSRPRSTITAVSSHKRSILAVGVPVLINLPEYTILVSARHL
jgi:hypothetical protein